MTRSNTILAIFVALLVLTLLAFGLGQERTGPGDVRTRVVHEMAATLEGMLGASGIEQPHVTSAQVRVLLLCSAGVLLVLASAYLVRAWRRGPGPAPSKRS
jgi:hypothetical protein